MRVSLCKQITGLRPTSTASSSSLPVSISDGHVIPGLFDQELGTLRLTFPHDFPSQQELAISVHLRRVSSAGAGETAVLRGSFATTVCVAADNPYCREFDDSGLPPAHPVDMRVELTGKILAALHPRTLVVHRISGMLCLAL